MLNYRSMQATVSKKVEIQPKKKTVGHILCFEKSKGESNYISSLYVYELLNLLFPPERNQNLPFCTVTWG